MHDFFEKFSVFLFLTMMMMRGFFGGVVKYDVHGVVIVGKGV